MFNYKTKIESIIKTYPIYKNIKHSIYNYKSQNTLLSDSFSLLQNPYQGSPSDWSNSPYWGVKIPPLSEPQLHLTSFWLVERPRAFHYYFPKFIRAAPTFYFQFKSWYLRSQAPIFIFREGRSDTKRNWTTELVSYHCPLITLNIPTRKSEQVTKLVWKDCIEYSHIKSTFASLSQMFSCKFYDIRCFHARPWNSWLWGNGNKRVACLFGGGGCATFMQFGMITVYDNAIIGFTVYSTLVVH